MYVNSDFIVVPYHYDLVTVSSTASFLMFIDRLRKAVGKGMDARLFAIPNMNDGRVGKCSELVIWENAREAFSNHATVTPKIPKRADMERFSTIAALDMQSGIVAPAFDRIYSAIFGTLEPLRKNRLTGIQLAENIYPKSKKKKQESEATGTTQGTDEICHENDNF